MRVLKDTSGVYNLDAVAAITPGSATGGHAVLHFAGGGAAVTATPFDDAVAEFTAPVAAAPVATLAPVA